MRDKSRNYGNLILAFYILALVAMAAQWAARSTVGRLQFLDDGNMIVVLLVNTLLFAVCYRMSWTGLGRDMWNIEPHKITETLLVSIFTDSLLSRTNPVSAFLAQRNRLFHDSRLHQDSILALLLADLPGTPIQTHRSLRYIHPNCVNNRLRLRGSLRLLACQLRMVAMGWRAQGQMYQQQHASFYACWPQYLA